MPEAMKDGCGDDVENQPGAVVDREDFGFLLKAGQPQGTYQLPVECGGLRLDLPAAQALSGSRPQRCDLKSSVAPVQLNANASKLEHSSTRLAAVSARNPLDTKS
jgi:hypothetical protein